MFKAEKVFGVFSFEDLTRIKTVIKAVEFETSAEIRVELRDDFEAGIGDATVQARRDFMKHGMAKTHDKTGVLILLIWQRKQLVIWAGERIYTKLPLRYWQWHAGELAYHFRSGNYVNALMFVLKDIGGHLAKNFPKKADDINELPDDVIVEGK